MTLRKSGQPREVSAAEGLLASDASPTPSPSPPFSQPLFAADSWSLDCTEGERRATSPLRKRPVNPRELLESSGLMQLAQEG